MTDGSVIFLMFVLFVSFVVPSSSHGWLCWRAKSRHGGRAALVGARRRLGCRGFCIPFIVEVDVGLRMQGGDAHPVK